MNVKELIELLEQCHSEKTILISAPEAGVFKEKISLSEGEFIYIEAEEDYNMSKEDDKLTDDFKAEYDKLKESHIRLNKQIEILKGMFIEKGLQKYCYCDKCVGSHHGMRNYQKELREQLLVELEKDIQIRLEKT